MSNQSATLRLLPLAVTALLALASCRPDQGEAPPAPAQEPAPEAAAPAAQSQPARSIARPSSRELAGDFIRGRVVDTMDAGSYTYVQVEADGDKAWAAAPRFTVGLGDEVTVTTSMPMPNHQSHTLDRTFDLVYFCSRITVEGQATDIQAMEAAHSATAQVESPDLSGIQRAEGGSTVAEIINGAKTYSGQDVAIRGRVVKFTGGIMGRNWLHLQDGSGEHGDADLTITTDDRAAVGDLVLVEGRVATDQDFGYGYAYAVLVQDASITIE